MSVELKFRERQDWKEAEQDKANEQLAAAVRKYLFETAQISHDPQWEYESDFALLAVVRVVLQQVCYGNLWTDAAYDLVTDAINDLIVRLEDEGCEPNDGPWGETPHAIKVVK